MPLLRNILFIINCSLFILPCFAQQQVTMSYTRARTMTDATGNNYIETYEYYDGLGRPIQTVQKGYTPAGNDLATFRQYDSQGRESKQWLPVPVNNNTGAFVMPVDYRTAAEAFYNDERPFTLKIYESAPNGRPIIGFPAGEGWVENPSNYEYLINDTPIVTWRGGANNSFTAYTYPNGSLYIFTESDPDGRQTREYKDFRGRLIMQERYDDNTQQWLQLRYVYDIYDMLVAMIPPAAENNVHDANYCYYYRYDYRNRVIEEHIPGAGWKHNVYDRSDRLVYTQDALQRQENIWLRYDYDDLDREIALVECYLGTANYSRETLQQYVNNNTLVFFNSTNNLRETVYDKYINVPAELAYLANNVSGSTYAASNRGRITATTTAILPPDLTPNPSPNGEGSLTTVFYYDNYSRVIQTVSTNHVGGIDRVSTKYDFQSNVLATLQQSSWLNDSDDPGSLTLRQTISYDAMKRPTKVNLLIGEAEEQNIMLLPQDISRLVYDDLGRVKEKWLHKQLQPGEIIYFDDESGIGIITSPQIFWSDTIKYTYNIQNWLKTISGNLFTQELFYEQVPSGSGVIPQFGGNISGMSWKTPSKDKATYAFTYDGVSRLTNSQLSILNSQFSNSYTEHLTYDKNGNITTLKRYGANGLINNMAYSYNGNQVTNIVDYVINGMLSGKTVLPLTTNYIYDANGNTVKEGSTSMTYNLLNLPQQVQLVGGRSITNTYAADGRKLATVAKDGNVFKDGTKKYNGNLVFDMNGDLEYILFSEGRILHNPATNGYSFEYALKDHLGSTRVTFIPNGNTATVTQEIAYYPGGAPIAALSYINPSLSNNRYFREGMEYVSDHNWNRYDYHARTYCPWRLQFDQLDPLGDITPHVGGYVAFMGNPLRYTDPTGMIAQDGSSTLTPPEPPPPPPQDVENTPEVERTLPAVTVTAKGNNRARGMANPHVRRLNEGQNAFLRGAAENPFTHFVIFVSTGGLEGGVSLGQLGWTTLSRFLAKEAIKRAAKGFSKVIHVGKQGKHIVGHNNYEAGKSILSKDAQKLLDAFHSGDVKSAQVINSAKVRVDFGEIIGTCVNETGQAVSTTKGIIINSNTGVHIVPCAP